jgi:hypothetical protein
MKMTIVMYIYNRLWLRLRNASTGASASDSTAGASASICSAEQNGYGSAISHGNITGVVSAGSTTMVSTVMTRLVALHRFCVPAIAAGAGGPSSAKSQSYEPAPTRTAPVAFSRIPTSQSQVNDGSTSPGGGCEQ